MLLGVCGCVSLVWVFVWVFWEFCLLFLGCFGFGMVLRFVFVLASFAVCCGVGGIVLGVLC